MIPYHSPSWLLSPKLILEAASGGKTELLERAWNFSANLDIRADDSSTPLHCAARSGHAFTVQRLLEMGVSLEAINDKMRTPLHEALLSQSTETVRALLQAQANVYATDSRGHSAI
ncbi:ankyrin, partial [Byssothecium circinans]